MGEVDQKELLLYIDECFTKILEKNDVLQVIAMDENYDPVRSTMHDRQINLDYTGLFGSLLMKARRAVRLMDANDTLLEIRVRTNKHETFITPDHHVTFITIQNPIDRI
ncbi:dynein light chain roadblock-type 2-like [Lutzomyia longipalpis]|uniref:dynein light chain roadblock-type 2-like n=1 Tax=Lutzomyia longipalpis TaxID=7200 RepID=UPI002483F1B3|nr:dynein light chain roadblock-type 2-like [Lutzomyia longipalpis]